jgi:hypothetical protein
MHWYTYVEWFFAGAFLSNTVPHFIHGVSGDPFPTPFAKPPGKGLSSPPVNMVWSIVNLIAGLVLFRVGAVWSSGWLGLGVCVAGIAAMGLMASVQFQNKHRS